MTKTLAPFEWLLEAREHTIRCPTMFLDGWHDHQPPVFEGPGRLKLNASTWFPEYISGATIPFKIRSLTPKGYMTTLLDVAKMLKDARKKAGLSQEELAQRAGVSRTTVARMETAAKGDMSVSALVRLLEAAGYDLKAVKLGHVRTVEDILAEQRQGDTP